ncbi:hypothetical protein CMTB2_02253 [Caminibacter mediatlanticus TB-2]|uniref:Peptidoglycan binding-like domain-containing protein n=2 Tax=Caminibacter mediatlanticus TaxID=291048 RepID=A0AAI9AIS5_9BACT|nr:hypothetical protein CMTB2_02253 [Caminibacter mediatlanticus TB-2]
MKMNKKILFSSVITTLLFMSGCADKTTNMDITKKYNECNTQLKECQTNLQNKNDEIAKLQNELNLEKQKVASTKNELNQCKAEVLRLPRTGLTLLPPQAKPGECFARVVIPPKYEYQKVKVLVDEGGERVVTIPPKYRWVTKKVLVREAGEKLITIPPVYKTVTEKVLVSPETEKEVVVKPAKYKWVTEKVMVEPAHTVWKRGASLYEGKNNQILDKKFNPETGEIMCLVEVPAKYKYIKKRIMVEPPVVKKVKVPAVYKTITKRVLVKPAQTKVVKIPAVYKTIKVRELVEPAKVVREPIPPKYAYITKRVKVRDIEYKWMPIICKTNLTPGLVKKLQTKLKKLGYYKGPIDSIYGPKTQKAVNEYQKDKGLAQGALTIETAKSLNIIK